MTTYVYFAEGSDYDASKHLGIFSTLEKAQEYILNEAKGDLKHWDKPYWTYTINEWQLDGKKFRWWRLEYDGEGKFHWETGEY